MRDVSIVINARLNSTRLPQKLIRPFADTTIIDLALERLDKIDSPYKFIATRDDEIIQKVSRFEDRIKVLARTEESVKPNTEKVSLTTIFNHYSLVPTKYVMIMNPCFPFARVSTIEKALEYFKKSDCKTMTAVIKSGNIFFDDNKKPINLDGNNASTQWNRDVYEMAHLFHIIDRDYFFENEFYWKHEKSDPEFYEVEREECYDVDTPNEFTVCECLYRAGYKEIIGE